MARCISTAILDVLAEAGARDIFGMVGDVIRVKLKSGGWEEVGRVAYPVD